MRYRAEWTRSRLRSSRRRRGARRDTGGGVGALAHSANLREKAADGGRFAYGQQSRPERSSAARLHRAQPFDLTAINFLLFAGVVLVIWLLIAILAAAVAPDDRPWSFFWCTLLLGELVSTQVS
jgi:hypothetical protein